MANETYPLKHVRLEQLHNAGFNIADFICFPPRTLRGREEELRAFLALYGRISCRHFHEDESRHFKCPVLYDETDFEKILAFCLEHNQNYYTLCNEAIDPLVSVCAGNILVFNGTTYFVEYFYGPGTPRDIESKGPDELKTYGKTIGQPAEGDKPPEEVLRMVVEARKFKPLENKAYILEFSLYPYPIGRQKTNIICWEWRWGWLHYQLQANKFLLQENQHLRTEKDKLKARIVELEHDQFEEDEPEGPFDLVWSVKKRI